MINESRYYPTLVRIEKDGSCWEWDREKYSLAQFGSSQFDSASSDKKWISILAPYSRIGLWKYRLGTFVQFIIEFYQEYSKSRGTAATIALAGGIFVGLAVGLLAIIYLSIYIFSPRPEDEHPHRD